MTGGVMQADNFQGRWTRTENSFNDFICSGVKRIEGRLYGHVFPVLLLRKYRTQANRVGYTWRKIY